MRLIIAAMVAATLLIVLLTGCTTKVIEYTCSKRSQIIGAAEKTIEMAQATIDAVEATCPVVEDMPGDLFNEIN